MDFKHGTQTRIGQRVVGNEQQLRQPPERSESTWTDLVQSVVVQDQNGKVGNVEEEIVGRDGSQVVEGKV